MATDNTTVDIELTGAIIQNNSNQAVSGTNYKLYTAQHFASPYNMVQGTFYYKIEPSFMIKKNVTKIQLFYPSTAGGYKELTGPLPGFPSTVYPVIVSAISDYPSNTEMSVKVSIPDDNTVSGVDSSKNWKVVIKMTPTESTNPPVTTVDLTGSVDNATIEPNTGFKTDGSTPYTLTFTASDGYRFKTDTDITEGGATHNQKWRFATAGKTSLVDTVTWDNGVTTLTVTGETEKIPTPKLIQQLTNVKSDFTAQTLDINKAYTINLTPANGYEFTADDTGKIGYYDGAGEYSKISDITRTDSTHAVVGFTCPDTSEDITLQMSASEVQVKETTLNLKLTNATLANFSKTIPDGKQTLTFTASDGYVFDKDGSISAWDMLGTAKTTKITANNQSTLSVDYTVDADHTQQIVITLSASEKVVAPTIATVEYKADNINITPKPDSVQIGSTNSMTITPDTGYKLNNNGTITQYAKDGTVIQSTQITVDNYREETASYTVAQNVDHIIISLVAVENAAITLTKKLTNAHLEPDMETLEVGEVTFHLVSDNNAIFDKQGTFGYYDDAGEWEQFDIPASNKATLDYTITIPDGAETAQIEISATVSSVETSGGFANIYKTTPSEMNALANEVLWTTDSSGDLQGINQNDFITNFYRIPFDIPSTELQPNAKFALGKYKSQTSTNQVLHDILTYDLGTINVVEKYNDSYDYNGVNCKLYLPFMPAVELKATDVINKPFSIKYQIDMFTGNANANIVSQTDNLLYSGQTKLSTDLPFLQVDTNKVGVKTNNTFNNGILNAFVIVSRNIPIDDNFIYPTLEKGRLHDYKSNNVTVSDIELPDTLTHDDSEQIKALLEKGVYIK